jgi:hypothetical protein
MPPLVEIRGYTAETSVRAGATLAISLGNLAGSSTTADLKVYRKGVTDALVTTISAVTIPGHSKPPEYGSWQWPTTYTLSIGSGWASGLYVLKPYIGTTAYDSIPFVVRPAAGATPRAILYEVAVATWQAYNSAGRSLYYQFKDANGNVVTTHVNDGSPCGYDTVVTQPFASFDRPYMYDSSGPPWDNVDAVIIAFLEGQGYTMDYCTSIDLHREPTLLDSTRLLLSVGHEENWSWEMREAVEAFIGNGGNAAFLSGDIFRWQCRFDTACRMIYCWRDAYAGKAGYTSPDPMFGVDDSRVTTYWRFPPPGVARVRFEDQLAGTSGQRGGAWYSPSWPYGPHKGHSTLSPAHWALAGTGLSLNDAFGGGTNPSTDLIGFETEGSYFVDNGSPRAVSPYLADPASAEPRFIVLAAADLTDPPEKGGFAAGGDPGSAGITTMGIFRNNGVVFNGAATNWAKQLAATANASAIVRAITLNVMRELSLQMPALPPLLNLGFETGGSTATPPDHWSSEGTGTHAKSLVEKVSGSASLKLDATAGQTWSSQNFVAEGFTYYRVGVWAKCSSPNKAGIQLQSTNTYETFAQSAYHSGSGAWEYLSAVGKKTNEGGAFGARVKCQVEAGGVAYFDDVKVDFT